MNDSVDRLETNIGNRDWGNFELVPLGKEQQTEANPPFVGFSSLDRESAHSWELVPMNH